MHAFGIRYLAEKLRWFKDERREVPFGLESAWSDFRLRREAKGRAMSTVLPAFLVGFLVGAASAVIV